MVYEHRGDVFELERLADHHVLETDRSAGHGGSNEKNTHFGLYTIPGLIRCWTCHRY